MKIYLVFSGIYAIAAWFFYGNYIEHLLVSRQGLACDSRATLEKLRLFSYKSTGLRFIMLKKETWKIDDKLNRYMVFYISSVINLMLVALFIITSR